MLRSSFLPTLSHKIWKLDSWKCFKTSWKLFYRVLCFREKTAGSWQHLSLQKEWMMLRSTFLPTFSHMLTSSKSFQRALYLRAKSRFLTEFDASKRMRSTFLPVRFSKLFQNLLKAVLTCSVLSSKRQGFDGIRVFRDNEGCWDQHFFQNFLSNLKIVIWKSGLTPVKIWCKRWRKPKID